MRQILHNNIAQKLTTFLGLSIWIGAHQTHAMSSDVTVMETSPELEAADPCGAAPLQDLVGQFFEDIDLAAYAPTRVLQSRGAMSLEFIASRRNIVLSEDDQTILRIFCG